MESVTVAARIRPANSREVKQGDISSIVKTDQKKTIEIHPTPEAGGTGVSFGFDHIFGQDSTQEQVFNALGTGILDNVIAGFNSTVFVYGQTGTGKTFTMMGDDQNPGLIPRIIENLFMKLEGNSSATLSVSYVEVYQEKVRDLINNGKEVAVRVLKDNIEMPGLIELQVSSAAETMEALVAGAAKREIHSTNMNAGSSRSHTVFTIQLTTENEQGHQVSARMNLVDLAGRENEKNTQVTGERMKELIFINKSLFFLAQCVRQLSSTKLKGISGFRDSKLTLLLSSSLQGNSKTLVVSTLSPSADAFEEDLITCRFAETAKKIKTNPLANTKGPDSKYVFMQQSLNAALDRVAELEGVNQVDVQRLRELEAQLIEYDKAQRQVKELEVLKSKFKVLHKEHKSDKKRTAEMERTLKKFKAKRMKELKERENGVAQRARSASPTLKGSALLTLGRLDLPSSQEIGLPLNVDGGTPIFPSGSVQDSFEPRSNSVSTPPVVETPQDSVRLGNHDSIFMTPQKRFTVRDNKIERMSVNPVSILALDTQPAITDKEVTMLKEELRLANHYITELESQLQFKRANNELQKVDNGISEMIGRFEDIARRRLDNITKNVTSLGESMATLGANVTRKTPADLLRRMRRGKAQVASPEDEDEFEIQLVTDWEDELEEEDEDEEDEVIGMVETDISLSPPDEVRVY